jgi:LysR family cyn operon transcriptional activator
MVGAVMDLRGLQCFVGVAEDLSFSRAADRLEISQPALSRQIKRLEGELGARLFDRVARRVALTVAGEDLLARARALLQDAESLRTRARDVSGGSSGVLRVGATPQTLESLVSQLLTRYRRVCPKVEVQLVEAGAASLLEQIDHGLVNVAIAGLPRGTLLRGRGLFPLAVLAVVPGGHRLSRRRRVEVTDLVDEPLLLLRKGFMTRQLFDGACQVAHLTPRVILESSSPHCLLSLVEGGHGIAIIPSTVRMAVLRHRVLPLQQEGRQLGLWMSVIWDPRRYLPPAARIFIEEAYRFTRRQYPGKGFGLGELVDSSAVG